MVVYTVYEREIGIGDWINLQLGQIIRFKKILRKKVIVEAQVDFTLNVRVSSKVTCY